MIWLEEWGDGMIYALQHGNGLIYDDNFQEMDKLNEGSYCLIKELVNTHKKYLWVEDTIYGEKYLKVSDNIVFLSDTGWGRGVLHHNKKYIRFQKSVADTMTIHVIIINAIGGESCQ